MEKVILKKVRQRIANNGDAIGFFKPIFINKDDDFCIAKSDDFPNDGVIYMPKEADYYDEKSFCFVNRVDIVDNTKYEEQLSAYTENPNNQNPSKFILYANKVFDILPVDLIPIYSNKFSIKTRSLTETGNISCDVFFLENNECIYGPFKKNNLELSSFNFKSYKDDFDDSEQYEEFLDLYSEYDGEFIFKIDKDKLSKFLINDTEGNLYLVGFKSIIENKIGESILFCNDSEVLNWGNKQLNQFNPKLKEALETLNSSDFSKKDIADKEKWHRYKELLESEADEEKIKDIQKILANKGVLGIADTSNLKAEFEEYKKQTDNKLKDKGDEIIELKTQIENYKFEPTTNTNLTELDNYPIIKESLKDKEKFEEKLSTLKEVTHYQGQIELLKEQYKKDYDSNIELSTEKDKIIGAFDKAKNDLTSELAKAKIYNDLLNGIEVLSTSNSAQSNSENQFVPAIVNVDKNTAKEYIEELRNRLKNQGRNYSFNDVANLTITLNQSFLTILAGAPGVGKTSLADKFAKSMGLSEQFGYLEIPCAKGWNSSKDLIGFYNPLNQKFQSSKTKLKEALEASSRHKNAPFVVLLDEANLSPMEHYWSDFIKLADFDYDRKIKISDKESIEIAKGFRFLATINHDHTTEMLSNRLLDRASIIQIEKPRIDDDKLPDNKLEYSEIFDFESVKALFKETSRWSEEWSLKNKLDEIINLLEDKNSGLIISPRKRNSVINYMRVATGLLDGNGNDFIALDYALSQQIFPLINMRGEKFEDSLKTIKDLLQKVGMGKSDILLGKIIDRGKEFKHFKYIYY